ncbi:MAG: IMP cyclohydrolase [Myxococcota bacterium]
MYVGRIVSVARTRDGRNAALYRVSSRSFPNRRVVDQGGRLAVIPREGHEGDVERSPYIAYHCLRVAGGWAIATNGSQTDPIAEKVADGMPIREALAHALLTLDYERDDYSTPRIAAAVPARGDEGWLAIVRRDALIVRSVALEAGRARWLATYEGDDVRDSQASEFDADTAEEAARFAIRGGAFASLEKPVTAAAALAGAGEFRLAAHTPG